MSKFFNVFLLNLLIISGRYRFDAFLLDPPTLDKVDFEIEDSEFIENLPKPQRLTRSYSEPPEDRKAQDENDLEAVPWPPKPFVDAQAQLRKCNLVESERTRRSLGRYLSGGRSPRYLDYANSQMPFNEGKLRKKSAETKKPEEEKKVGNGNSRLDLDEHSDAGTRRKRSGRRRRRFFDVPFRSKNLEIPRDDPLMEYHKRAKKQIRTTYTLEAKEAAMSRVLDPNLNLDGILEPHVRKRRGLHSKKRNCSFKPRRHLRSKRQKKAVDASLKKFSFEFK